MDRHAAAPIGQAASSRPIGSNRRGSSGPDEGGRLGVEGLEPETRQAGLLARCLFAFPLAAAALVLALPASSFSAALAAIVVLIAS